MANINYTTREITIKVVYYGPGLSGKTTNLEYIHKQIQPEKRGKLLSLETKEDRTVFFDLLPVEVGTLGSFQVRAQLFTVPGSIKYGATRKLVVKSADGLVFVADSQSSMMDFNIESLKSMQNNLRINGLDFDTIPLVIQYNKQDLDALSSLEELDKRLNIQQAPTFRTVAKTGEGIMETYQAIIKMVMESLQNTLDTGVSPLSAPVTRTREHTGPEQIRIVTMRRLPIDMEEIKLDEKIAEDVPLPSADIFPNALSQFSPQQMEIIKDIRLRVNKLLADNNKIAAVLKKLLTQMDEISRKIDGNQ